MTGSEDIGLWNVQSEVFAQDGFNHFSEFGCHVELREHDELNGIPFLKIDCDVVDLNLEFWYFLKVEDMIGRTLHNQLSALINCFFLCLDISYHQLTEVALHYYPLFSPLDIGYRRVV